MDLKNLLNSQLNLLLSDKNYSVPMDLEMDIEDQTGYCRDYCTETEQYLDSQLTWLSWILDRPEYKQA